MAKTKSYKEGPRWAEGTTPGYQAASFSTRGTKSTADGAAAMSSGKTLRDGVKPSMHTKKISGPKAI